MTQRVLNTLDQLLAIGVFEGVLGAKNVNKYP
jgi:hypothetical protein